MNSRARSERACPALSCSPSTFNVSRVSIRAQVLRGSNGGTNTSTSRGEHGFLCSFNSVNRRLRRASQQLGCGAHSASSVCQHRRCCHLHRQSQMLGPHLRLVDLLYSRILDGICQSDAVGHVGTCRTAVCRMERAPKATSLRSQLNCEPHYFTIRNLSVSRRALVTDTSPHVPCGALHSKSKTKVDVLNMAVSVEYGF